MSDQQSVSLAAVEVEAAFAALAAAELEKASAQNTLDAVREHARQGAPVSPDELTRAHSSVELATLRAMLVTDRLRVAQDAEKVATVEAKAGALLGSPPTASTSTRPTRS